MQLSITVWQFSVGMHMFFYFQIPPVSVSKKKIARRMNFKILQHISKCHSRIECPPHFEYGIRFPNNLGLWSRVFEYANLGISVNSGNCTNEIPEHSCYIANGILLQPNLVSANEETLQWDNAQTFPHTNTTQFCTSAFLLTNLLNRNSPLLSQGMVCRIIFGDLRCS